MDREASVDVVCVIEDGKEKQVKMNMFLMLMGQFVSDFGSSIYSFAISLYILQLTGSGLSFSISLAISTLPRVIFGPIAGVIADRIDRKKMVVTLDFLSGIAVLLLLGLTVVDELRLSYVYCMTFILSTCHMFFAIPFNAAMPTIVDEKRLTKANSLSQLIDSIASMSGPFVGGLVFAMIDIKLFLLINGLSFIFSAVSEMFIDFEINKQEKIVEENVEGVQEKGSFIKDFKEGLAYLVSQKWLLMIAGFMVIFNMCSMIGINVPMPYIVNEVRGFTSTQFGILNMVFPIGMLVSASLISIMPEPKSNYRRLVGAIAIYSVTILGIGIVTIGDWINLPNTYYLIILMVLYAVMSICSAFINIPMSIAIQKLVPNEMLGRVMSVVISICMALGPVGAIVGGVLVDAINPTIIPFACGVLMMVITGIMLVSKELRKI